MAKEPIVINWEPQPRQLVCLKACGLDAPFTNGVFKPAIAKIIGYGGAAGGGKTDTMVGASLVASVAYPGINIGCFRRKFPQLQGLGGFIERSKQIIPESLATYHSTAHRWTFVNGSKVAFNHCQNPSDVENYQSQQFDILMLDETTQFGEEMIKYLRTRNRATVDYPTFRPFTLFATNPGGVGHAYFKSEFVDIGEPEKVHNVTNETGVSETHIFIPAKLTDNVILTDRDPGYVDTLSPNVKIRRRLLEGDWDVFSGQVFNEFRRNLHVTRSFTPNLSIPVFMWIDWGYSGKEAHKGAFAAILAALVKCTYTDENGDKIPFNRIIAFKEWYGKYKRPDTWAEDIFNEIPPNITLKHGVADSAMFNTGTDGSRPIEELMREKWKGLNNDRMWLMLRRGTKNRIGRVATTHNWLGLAPDKMPYLWITEDCKHLIRSLPTLVYDEHRDEDVDCFVKGTKVSTPNGNVRIEDIRVGTLVDTPVGPRQVIRAGVSGGSERVVEVRLSSGEKLKGTANHKVCVMGEGLVELQQLQEGNILMGQTSSSIIGLWKLKKLYTGVLHLEKVVVEIITGLMEQVSEKVLRSCIGKYTKIILAKFRRGMTYIIKIITVTTIAQIIWRQCLKLSMPDFITKLTKKIKRLKTGFINGTERKKERNNSEKMLKKCVKTHQRENCRAEIVGMLLKLNTLTKYYAKSVNTLKGTVRLVVPSVVTSFFKRRMANVLPGPVRIVAVGNYEEDVVYKLTVEEAHLYYANGVLVTNTEGEDHLYDALSYGLTDIRFIPGKLGGVKAPGSVKKALPAVVHELDLVSFERSGGKKKRDWKAL